MTEARQGEIALKLIKRELSKNGVSDSVRRNMGNEAKDIGIDKDEMEAFIHAILPGVMASIFGWASCRIESR
ncbi:MAG: hypothetical protein A3C06_03260 [Candidatus Taylorbacteria bacterium RIFCSPHIGHO2_02_FULL_46_13]|uniref:Uncharacterized protein n=1 Tax=Candidatus Taylorbacteria bacterium RIFCSPHIGHO2_02_FULL_46_13 TaxID=1802312 RepID=A0A1G2MRP1_9BACT|nr:MAG: hypothetical protein A3C06_03260 [Candidatus Taylorbacteria bacterium RIFCSPHIGHO2_02_FULL_46_13]